MIGKKMLAWIGAGLVSAATIPAVAATVAHKAAAKPAVTPVKAVHTTAKHVAPAKVSPAVHTTTHKAASTKVTSTKHAPGRTPVARLAHRTHVTHKTNAAHKAHALHASHVKTVNKYGITSMHSGKTGVLASKTTKAPVKAATPAAKKPTTVAKSSAAVKPAAPVTLAKSTKVAPKAPAKPAATLLSATTTVKKK